MTRNTFRALPHITVCIGLVLFLAACASLRSPVSASTGAVADPVFTETGSHSPTLTLVSGDNPLSGDRWTVASNGSGPVELDASVGGPGRGDGHTLTLAGTPYPRGYGVHAGSSLSFATGSRCRTLSARIGVDDEVGAGGSVRFEVRGDGLTLYESGVMTGNSATRHLTVDISGRNTVQLIVSDAGDGNASDHADWALPTLLGCDVSSAGSGAGLTPEQYGARGDGMTDDTTALNALFGAMNTRSATVTFGAGRVYRFHRTAPTQFTVTRSGTVIDGNGATLKVVDSQSVSAPWYGLRVAGADITVTDLTIDLNRAHRPGSTSLSAQTAWFIDGGSRDVILRGIRALNAPLDGIYVRDLVSSMPTPSPAILPTRILLEHAEVLNSGRNNLSVVSARDVTIRGGRFNGAGGVPGGPWAGIDIEPNRGSDVHGNRGIVIDGAETSDNRGSGVDIAQVGNDGITIRDHTAHRNGGAALFLSPSGTITVDGLRASTYGSVARAGVIAVVPSDVPGATVTLGNLEVSDTTGHKPTFFQNYAGRVSLDGLRASNVATTTVLGTYQPTTVTNVYVDGVRIR